VQDERVLGATYGVHPNSHQQMTSQVYSALVDLFLKKEEWKAVSGAFEKETSQVAVGECGIDLHKNKVSTLESQRRCFGFQVRFAQQFGLPIVIHCRNGRHGNAFEVVMEVLRKVSF